MNPVLCLALSCLSVFMCLTVCLSVSCHRFSDIQAYSSLRPTLLVGGGWGSSQQKEEQRWKIARTGVSRSELFVLTCVQTTDLIILKCFSFKAAECTFAPQSHFYFNCIGSSHICELEPNLSWHVFLCHCYPTPFVGHWEMDGVKPKAGLWPPVVDC